MRVWAGLSFALVLLIAAQEASSQEAAPPAAPAPARAQAGEPGGGSAASVVEALFNVSCFLAALWVPVALVYFLAPRSAGAKSEDSRTESLPSSREEASGSR